MKIKLYKQCFFILVFFCLFSNITANSSNNIKSYSKENISNYFSGLLSSRNNDIRESREFFVKIKELSKIHFPFVKEYLSVLVQEQEIEKATDFLRNIDNQSNNFSEANIILGANYLAKKKYDLATENLNLVNQDSQSSNFDKLIANILINYSKVFDKKEIEDKKLFQDIPENYENFTIIQEAFINCYLNKNVDESFLKLLNFTEIDYTRYIFFYVNYLFSKKRNNEAVDIIKKYTDILDSNILLDQTKFWIKDKKYSEITKIFDCKNPEHLLSEFFYVIANLYSGEQLYNKSNFYLNLSIYFNPKFQINQALLAENYLQMEEYKKSKKIYEIFNKKNTIFYWHSVKKISLINSDLENETKALSFLINNFNNIKDPNLKIIYDVANLYRGFGKFKESIDYYTKVINILDNKHPSYADILYRRGASYERIKMWENSDKDLLESLKINPDDPHVLNYLAYSWLERNYKIDEAMDMLLLAHNERPNDPYITDSVGWAYYLQGDYVKAKKFIRQAIKLLPSDPIINDHYADILWKLNKPLQANYFWKYVLNLEDIKPETKKKIKNKLIFGV